MPKHWTSAPFHAKCSLGPHSQVDKALGPFRKWARTPRLKAWTKCLNLLGTDTSMVFLTAGMGGGTGTGAAPVIAQACKERGILTVGIVTVPFLFEGRRRNQQATEGLEQMRAAVDTLLIIRNDKLRELFGNQTIRSAFANADQILCTAAKGIAEVITLTGEINVDMNDVNTVMRDSGRAIMGSGSASGQGRAAKAVTEALESPLLNDSDITGADHVLLNITFGTEEILMDEIMEITDHIQEAAGQTAEVIWGYGTDENLGEDLCVTVIATGFEGKDLESGATPASPKKHWLSGEDNDQAQPEAPAAPTEATPASTEPFLLTPDNPTAEEPATERLNWDVSAPQKELFPSAEQNIESDVPSDAHLTNLPLNHLNHAEEEATPEDATNETEAAPEEGFVIYNLDDAPEPQDLTPETPQASQPTEATEPQAQPSVQPSREAFAERQRQITRNLADFKSKLNLPGRIADLENEPAYKRRNISIDDTPHSSESQMSRFQLNEEVDAEGNRRFELRDDNSFLHDNVD